jgi:hypothetical protein
LLLSDYHRFLEDDKFSIHLQLRENGEIITGAYILKNDYKSLCFLEYWLSHHAPIPPTNGAASLLKHTFIDGPNSDNGAMVAAMSMLAVSAMAEPGDKAEDNDYMKCLQNLPSKVHNYPEHLCMMKYIRALYQVHGNAKPISGRHFPHNGVRVWWRGEGFWRTKYHERDILTAGNDIELFKSLYVFCHPSSDIIGHGDKTMGQDFIEPYQSDQCDVIRAQQGDGKNPKCQWLSPEEELTTLRKHCQWRSPACVNNGRFPVNYTNVCIVIPSSDSNSWVKNPACPQAINMNNYVDSD